ncbi:calpain-9 [Latimeria chalumnae]|uniref:calpain-9 n=1 Tax=Latimeria chalumnae TaxID=7897 RepID=UPI00313F0C9F
MPYLFQGAPQNGPGDRNSPRTTQLSGKTYEELKRECLRRGQLFEDPDFPADDSSLFYSEKPSVPFTWKRPGEIVSDPQFIVGGATRTDICQGDLGDCWLLAAIASLTLNEKTLSRVIYPAQNFGDDYAGIFRFQFWQNNEWLDVIVDDRLPTFRNRLVFVHSAELNEFWSALLEKAYAKLYGSYEALKGGSTLEAMEDFTGGVGEMYNTKESPKNLYQIINKALKRGSMLGCSINISSSAESEARTSTGLVKGHAYSITGLEEVNYRGDTVQLIRVRNPWGQVEWNGPWSDNSAEWSRIDPSVRKRLSQISLDDGEFWMSFEDFKKNFDKIEICNLTPDSLDDNVENKWDVTVFQGSWVRATTAGGCRNFLDTFWTNPQFKLKLMESDDDDDQDGCTFIAALMQKNRRKLRKQGLDLLTVGFSIYECPAGGQDQLTKDFFRYHSSKARCKTYINMREVSDRFSLKCGEYVIIPTTFKPEEEADFFLRIFSEKKADASEMADQIDVDLPEPPEPNDPEDETEEERQFRYMFERLAGTDMEISPSELQHILNATLGRRQDLNTPEVSMMTCRSIVGLLDKDGSMKLGFPEFKVFWGKLKHWLQIFLKYDHDKSGSMSGHEFRLALNNAGFQLDNYLLQLVVLRYMNPDLQIELDDFISCLVRLEQSFRIFKSMAPGNKETITLAQTQLISLAMNI